ncbi:MAG: peptide deformylase [Patescibacteria group bacterium]|jgi:peptide deformylase
MSIIILLKGDRRLTQKSDEVSKFDKYLKDLSLEMIKYGKSVNNCVGLAGCQVGENKRMCVAEIDGKWNVFINPKIIYKSNTLSDEWEGCMSLKEGNLYGNVKRPSKIIVEYKDESFKRRIMQFEGFYSHLLQHEIDHMDGLMFLDRMEEPIKLLTDKDLEILYKDPE